MLGATHVRASSSPSSSPSSSSSSSSSLFYRQETAAQTRLRSSYKMMALVSGATRTLARPGSTARPPLLPPLLRKFTWLVSNRPGAGDPLFWILPFPFQQQSSKLVDQRRRGHACCKADSGCPPRCYASVDVRIILEITLYHLTSKSNNYHYR